MTMREGGTGEEKMRVIDIIVPCYNEEPNISRLYGEIEAAAEAVPDCRFRCIFVDDGSSDGTLEEIRRLAGQHDEVTYISFSRNFGKEAAMYAGIRNSTGDMALIMDADLQHPPAMIPEMIGRMDETGCDCCAARRVTRKGEPRIRSLGARMFYRLMNRYSEIDLADGAVDFRLMSRRMVKAICSMPETQRFSKGIFAWVGFETEWIEFENVKRIAGESKWSAFGLVRYALDGFLNFAASPLKFVGAFGCLVSVGSAIYFIAEIIKTLAVGKDTPGYASLLCLILFFGGLIVAILSLLGEYMGRIYMETKGRPVYIEKESNIEDRNKD